MSTGRGTPTEEWTTIRTFGAPIHHADSLEKARGLIAGSPGVTTRSPSTLEHTEAMRVLTGISVSRPSSGKAGGFSRPSTGARVSFGRPNTDPVAKVKQPLPPVIKPSPRSVCSSTTRTNQLRERQRMLRDLSEQVEQELSKLHKSSSTSSKANVQALLQTDGNVTRAIEVLLEQQEP